MDARNKIGTKSGLFMAIFWVAWGVIDNWHAFHTPGMAKAAVIKVIGGAIFMSLFFGFFFRRHYDPFGRHITILSDKKSNQDASNDAPARNLPNK